MINIFQERIRQSCHAIKEHMQAAANVDPNCGVESIEVRVTVHSKDLSGTSSKHGIKTILTGRDGWPGLVEMANQYRPDKKYILQEAIREAVWGWHLGDVDTEVEVQRVEDLDLYKAMVWISTKTHSHSKIGVIGTFDGIMNNLREPFPLVPETGCYTEVK